MARNYTARERAIASQDLPTRTLRKQLAEASYNRSIDSINTWRRVNRIFRSEKKKAEKPKLEPKLKEPNRFPIGLRDWLIFG